MGTDTTSCVDPSLAQPGQTPCTKADNTLSPDPVKSLGPTLVTQRDRPVRIKFTNKLPIGLAGDLFIPVDTSVMGAGTGAADTFGNPCNNTLEINNCASYTQNRSAIHLHGGRTPWISDGTPHQWIVPAGENTPFKKGVSLQNVPDMPDPGEGSSTYYYTNQQSARLMFYHEHAWGITRLNPYVGVAAGYLITDQWEQDLITREILPPFLDQIPLIIQDKTFVDATEVPHPITGVMTPKVRVTDPLWNWGSAPPTPNADPALNNARPPVTGDLWMPHVYMPAQTLAAGFGGVNPYGRWMYGPWFYPATVVSQGPIDNPYYDKDCSSPFPAVYKNCTTAGQPTKIPGTPNVSMGMEAFQDSAVVNGTAFPTLTVDPRAYRFRILNAANDRFWNLSFYKADTALVSPAPYFDPADPKYRPGLSNRTEVKIVPASAQLALDNNWPSLWPVDGRTEGVPDPGRCTGAEPNLSCPNFGPNFLQIGTEGGFLPKPVEIKPQPIGYNTDPTAFWVGTVKDMGLALGPAERADVIVDFTDFGGETLILYNDAPAAWPARVAGYDYFTGAPDMRDSGGYGDGGVYDPATGAFIVDPQNPLNKPHGPLPGFAPNTRTVMQVIVNKSVTGIPYVFSKTNLEAEFTAAAPATAVNPIIPDSVPPRAKTLFERSQEPIIVGQTAYETVYPDSYFPPNYPWEGINQINDHFLNFVTLTGDPVTVPTEPKGIHDEMGASFDPVYGRMSGNLAMQLPNPTTLNAVLVLYGYSDVPTEFVNNSTTLNVTVIPDALTGYNKVSDGTQIWKVSHNGVDTHPIHFHIFDVQLINRVGWDGQTLLPEPNELGWKDTIKISPLMDTIVAVRPRAPILPFGIPNSLRPLNPAIPIDSTMGFNGTIPPGSDWPMPLNNNTMGSGFSSIDWQTGQAYIGTDVPPYPYPNFKGVVTNILYDFGWEYVWHCHILSHEEMDMMRPIILNVVTTAPIAPVLSATAAGVLTWTDASPPSITVANPANEIGFRIERATDGGLFDTNYAKALANATTFTEAIIPANTTYAYRVFAYNATGDSPASNTVYVSTFPPVVELTAPATGYVYAEGAVVELTATAQAVAPLVITRVEFYANGVLLNTDTTAPYSFTWTNAASGTYDLTAVAYNNAALSTTSAVASITIYPLTITTNSHLPFTVGTFFDQTLAADFGTPPYTWTGVGTLPPGINFFPAAARLTGFPTLAGRYTFTATVTDSLGATTSKIFVLSSQPPMAVTTSTPLPSYTLGSGPFSSVTFAATGGNGIYTWTKTSGTLPAGTVLSTAGVLSGTPTAAGTFTFDVTATDSAAPVNETAVKTFTMTVAPVVPLEITTPNTLPSYQLGSAPFTGFTFAATGGYVGYTWAKILGTLPTGTSLTAGGVLTGTPTTAGTYLFQLQVTDSTSPTPVTTSKLFGMEVLPVSVSITTTPVSPTAISTYALGSGAYSGITFAAAGGNGSYTWSSTGTLPTGTSLTTGGVLTGTPTAAGTFTFNVTATDTVTPALTDTKSYTVVVTGVLPATSVSLVPRVSSPQPANSSIIFDALATGGDAGPYIYQFRYRIAVAGTAYTMGQAYSASTSYTWNTAALALPAGTYNVLVEVRHAGSNKLETQKLINYTLSPASPPVAITTIPVSPTAISTYALGSGAYAGVVFAATGGNGSYTWSSSGTLPTGTNLSTAGVLTGSPTAAGTYTFNVTATDAVNPALSDTKSYTVVVTGVLRATSVSLVPRVSSPQPVNTSVIFDALAAGGDSGPYIYQFRYRIAVAGTAYTMGQAYSASTSYTWDTAALALPAGTHNVLVEGKACW
ncbi:MAG: putative Ig domain-containing protein [Geobacteraceae bacterium]|nr:putative Ig domain-containing protein [Geobacteraceae bacterium]